MGVEFHWQAGEAQTSLVPPPQPPRRRLRRVLLSAAGLVVVLLIVGGAILWNRAEYGLRAAQADLQAVIDAEVGALDRGDEEVYLSLQDFNNRRWYRLQELFLSALLRADKDEVSKQTGERCIIDLDLRDGPGLGRCSIQSGDCASSAGAILPPGCRTLEAHFP